jgi:osmoprotectant transport system ATP-binding protein
MIKFVNVSKSFGDKLAVNNISFHINEGNVCVLLGPSGCGKSTTLRMTNRLIEADSGSVFIDNKDIKTYIPEELRYSIGYVIQSTGLMPHLTVSDNITLLLKVKKQDKQTRIKRAEELIELVGLSADEHGAKYPHQLSGGEAQRVGVARALAANPPYLLMDEPFGAVDPITRSKLQQEFIDLQKQFKKTILFVTHDLDEALILGDHIIIMKDGSILQQATPLELLSSPANQFIEDFIGPDRQIKRLHFITAGETAVSTAASPTSALSVTSDETLFTVLRKMITNSAAEALVTREGEHIGTLTAGDILKA